MTCCPAFEPMSHWGQTRLMVGSDMVCKSTTVCPSWQTRLWCIVRGAIWNTDSSESCHPCLCGPPCTGNGNASTPQGRVAPGHQQLPDRPCYAVGWWHLTDELLPCRSTIECLGVHTYRPEYDSWETSCLSVESESARYFTNKRNKKALPHLLIFSFSRLLILQPYFLIFCPLVYFGVGGAVRFVVVGTIGWSSTWFHSNTGLSSTHCEQIPIIFGVWPFWLTPFFFRSITFWRVYGRIVFHLLKLLSFFWLTYYCSIGACFSFRFG